MGLCIADSGRAEDELRIGSIKRADPLEPAQHVGDVRSENAPVGVDFVDNHVLQGFEELRPLGVVGQDPLVQHVRVRHHDVAIEPDGLALVPGRVAIECGCADTQLARPAELDQVGNLVLS